jgi:uncharacterized protein with HEPN domain
MSKHDDRVYLQHILDCINHVHGFTGGIIHMFHEVPQMWFATLRVLQTMSESAMKLSDKTKAAMPGIEWHRIKGFRNILVHDYLGEIDHVIIRKVVEVELPKLEQEAKRMLKELGDSNGK